MFERHCRFHALMATRPAGFMTKSIVAHGTIYSLAILRDIAEQLINLGTYKE